MQPNVSLYGRSSQWYNQHFTQDIPPQYRNKKPYFGGTNARIETAIANNKIIGGQPIDSSISYCGLGSESDLSHANTICRINGELIVKTIDRSITNFMLWEKSESQSFARMNGALYNNSQYGWTDNLSSDNINRYIEPLCSIKPTNQVLEIRVYAYSPTLDTTIDVDLDTYCSGGFIAHPQIQTVYVVCQWGSSPERGANIPNYEYMNVKFCIGLLDPYKYIDDTEVYNFALSAQDRSNIGILSGMSNVVYSINAVSDNLPVFYGDIKMYTVAPTSDNMVRVYRDITNDNIDDVKEYYLRQAACFGLYFSPKHSVAINGALTDPDMYIGILDTNGVGHGEYLRGANTVNAPQNNLTDMFDIEYNPSKSDNTNYTNDTHFYYQIPAKSAIKYYVLTESQLNNLLNKLYSATVDDVQQGESIESHNLRAFLTTNGIDCISSLIKYPCEVLHGVLPESIKLGTYDSKILAYPLLFATDCFSFSFNLSKNNGLYPVYGDFRDNEPLTKAELTIPFCGTVQVPTTYLYQYDDLNIDLIIDYITGACTAVIMCNGIAIDSISGSCGIQLPVTGIQANNIDSAINALALQDNKRMTSLGVALIGGALAIGTAIFTGGATAIAAAAIGATTGIAGTAINAAQQGKQIDYELSHMDLPIKAVGGASAQIAQSMDMRCKLRITRPVMADSYNAEVYANTVGFACISNGKVSDYNGLTIGNIELDGVNCTAAEKDLIKTAFANGVYL